MTERAVFYRDQLKLEHALFRGSWLPELQKRVGKRFWKSQDISLRRSVFIPPGYTKYAPVNFPGNLEVLDGLPVDVITYMETSTRSRFAQRGLEVSGAGQTIAETLKDEIYKANGNSYPAFVPLINHGQRPIQIDRDTPIFRLYSSPFLTPQDIRAQGERLLQLLENGEIALTGEKGRDWEIAYAYKGDQDEMPFALMLRIDKNNRKWIAPGTTPIKISQEMDSDYRSHNDAVLRPVPSFATYVHWVGETTSKVTLAPFVNAVIEVHTLTSPRLDEIDDRMMRHLASPLVDAGFSNTIRTEIVSPTDKSSPNFVVLRVFKDL